MKGVNKCYGLLLVLATIFGLSLSVSSDTSAKQYVIDSFLVHGVTTAPNFGGINGPVYEFLPSFDTSTLNPRNTSYLITKYDSNSGKCIYDDSYINPGYTISSHSVSFHGNFYPQFSSYSSDIPLPLPSSSYPGYSNLPDYICQSSFPYGYHSDLYNFDIPEYDDSTTPFDKSLNVSSMLPYNYMFNVLYFNGSRTVDGITYDSSFDISELLNPIQQNSDSSNLTYYSDKISRVHFPLNFDSSKESLTLNKNIKLNGSFTFGDSLSQSDFSHLKVSVDYLYGSGNSTNRKFCSTSIASYDSNTVLFECNYRISNYPDVYSPGKYYFYFYIESDDVTTYPLSSIPQSITFGNFYLLLNEDSTPGGYGGFSQSGSFPNVAPGIPGVNSQDADWTSSLTNLFSDIWVLNPFLTLFGLFTDGSSCANIPLLASMIHAEETQVCPWFDSTTRNIVTPVIAVLATAILFGFIMRWLTNSSGNYKDDGGSK